MQLSANTRESRSKRRQVLCLELEVWVRREKDPDSLASPEKAEFCRQEQAKLRKSLRALDRGFTRQRAWSQGKLLY
jgi:hypothetical protein